MPNTAVEVEGLSTWELGVASIMTGAGAGSWLAGSLVWGAVCWVGCTKAVAWFWFWLWLWGVPIMELAWEEEEDCTLGLVDRTVPLVLPYMCSTGPSLDCWAGKGGGDTRENS